MCWILDTTYNIQNTEVVDLRGIEPLSPPCHGDILPVYYRPGLRNYITQKFSC